MPVTITHSTPADGTFSATGAAAWDATHTVSGLGTMAEQNANNVNITGGSITGVTGVLSSLTVNSTPTSGGAAGQIMFDTGSVLQESANLKWDNTNKVLTLNTGRISQTAGTLADLTNAFSLTATMPAITTAVTTAVNFSLTGAGSSAQQQIAFGVSFLAGYTGTSPTAGLSVNNANAGTDTSYAGGGSTVGYRPLGNRGGVYLSNGASAGLNTGVIGHAASSTTANYGVWGGATFGVLNSWNVGVAGFGLNTTTVTQQIGGFFALYDGSTAAPNLATAALVADNGSQSAPVFLARVNGATTWRINTVGDAAWGSSGDAIISRRGAANLRFGAADAAAPVAQTLSVQSVVAGTSNTAGANLTITGSQGTGTGAGGSIIFQVAPAGTTGTAQNALATALTIASDRSATFVGDIFGPTGVTLATGANRVVSSAGANILLGDSSDQYAVTISGAANAGVTLKSAGVLRWTNGTSFSGTADLFMRRRGAANLAFGAADAAAPVAQTLSVQSVVAGTSNTAGANLTITGSQGTGTGAGGSIIFQVAPAGASGTAQNALATLLSLNSDQTITYTYNTTAAGLVVSNATSLGVSSGGSVNIYTTNLPNAADQRLGQFLFGSTGSGTLNSSSITAYSEAAWTAGSSQATYIAFLTTALGSASRAERLRITGSGLLAFGGGGTSSFPALKRSTAILQVRLADDSAYAPVEASTVRTATAYTVATLPAAGTAGRKAYVTDATAPTFLGALIGGGAVVCPVFDNGTAWVAG